ncbi:MAG: family transposase [Steroidobacteraceae bacterium]|nr:family transposase [Steroidobacteraceae bacterium]
MTKPIERDPIYRGRRFQTETIELCLRCYITYRRGYRDLAAMMAERGVVVSHTSIMRRVLRYVPEFTQVLSAAEFYWLAATGGHCEESNLLQTCRLQKSITQPLTASVFVESSAMSLE